MIDNKKNVLYNTHSFLSRAKNSKHSRRKSHPNFKHFGLLAQLVEHSTLNRRVKKQLNNKYGLLAQLVEHSTLNRGVRGSSPRQSTNKLLYFKEFYYFNITIFV